LKWRGNEISHGLFGTISDLSNPSSRPIAFNKVSDFQTFGWKLIVVPVDEALGGNMAMLDTFSVSYMSSIAKPTVYVHFSEI